MHAAKEVNRACFPAHAAHMGYAMPMLVSHCGLLTALMGYAMLCWERRLNCAQPLGGGGGGGGGGGSVGGGGGGGGGCCQQWHGWCLHVWA